MFKKMRRKFYYWLRESTDSNEVMPEKIRDRGNAISKRSPTQGELDSQGLYFKVIPGAGGIAIEITHRDSRTGENQCSLHVIGEDEELGEELSKIITLETMRFR